MVFALRKNCEPSEGTSWEIRGFRLKYSFAHYPNLCNNYDGLHKCLIESSFYHTKDEFVNNKYFTFTFLTPVSKSSFGQNNLCNQECIYIRQRKRTPSFQIRLQSLFDIKFPPVRIISRFPTCYDVCNSVITKNSVFISLLSYLI